MLQINLPGRNRFVVHNGRFNEACGSAGDACSGHYSGNLIGILHAQNVSDSDPGDGSGGGLLRMSRMGLATLMLVHRRHYEGDDDHQNGQEDDAQPEVIGRLVIQVE